MRNIRLELQYDGTHYHGWQIQSRCETIQGKVLQAVQTMVNGIPLKLVGASRTDTGVHALGQVANFWIPEEVSITPEAFFHGLNSLTPDDIIITNVREEVLEFHARFDATGKTYCYQIWNAKSAAMYHRRFSWHIRIPLDMKAMRRAARHLVGCHDFRSFQASSCSAETSIRTVSTLHILQSKQLVRVWIRANAYLHRMVRNIVGTLVEVGMGRKDPENIRSILASKDRTLAGVTAPAQGLFLIKVHYSNSL